MNRNPPAFATWLLDKLGYTRHSAALTGDLLEEFHSGRSGAWYWRQAAIVMVKGMRRNAFSEVTLGRAAVVFAIPALVDCAFWGLHPPVLGDSRIPELAILFAAATLIGIWSRSRKAGMKGVAAISVVAAWLSLLCFEAWRSSDPLAVRVLHDLRPAVLAWLVFSLRTSANKEKTLP
jgi:hypothetical protein